MSSPPTMTRPSLRALLREVTRPLHDRTERASPLADRAADLPTAYRRHLDWLLQFHVDVAPRLETHAESLPAEGTLDAVHLLADDLGAPVPPRSAAPAPDCSTESHALGVLYVLEGALIGARVLAQRIAAAPPTGVGTTYLESGRPDRWNTLLEHLEAVPDDECAHVLAAAVDAFACLLLRTSDR